VSSRTTGDKGVVRDGVQDVREPSLLPSVPRREDSFEFFGNETTIVDFDRGPGHALCSNCVCQGGEGQLVGKEGVSPFPKEPKTLCDAVAVTESEGNQVIPRRMEGVHEFCHDFKGGRDSCTSTVSEGGLERKGPRTFSIGDCPGWVRTISPFGNWV
jgi:hypothetical protein